MAAGTDVILDIGLMRRADRARLREIADGAGLPLQFHFVTASQDARRARVADRNVIRGESFAIEVTPELFDFIEGVWEEPEPAELEGAIVSESG
jgi:predicted kinase